MVIQPLWQTAQLFQDSDLNSSAFDYPTRAYSTRSYTNHQTYYTDIRTVEKEKENTTIASLEYLPP